MSINKGTNRSKITKYKIEEDVINMRKLGYTYQEIADEVNNSGKVPEDDPLNFVTIARFINKYPEVNKKLVQEEKKRLLEVVNTNFDVYNEINMLYGKTSKMLDLLEERAIERNGSIDPYRFKAITSEMRENLRFMLDIQKEINDYNNIRKFMEIVIKVLQEEVPEKIPIIAERLRVGQDTKWFANIVTGSGADD